MLIFNKLKHYIVYPNMINNESSQFLYTSDEINISYEINKIFSCILMQNIPIQNQIRLRYPINHYNLLIIINKRKNNKFNVSTYQFNKYTDYCNFYNGDAINKNLIMSKNIYTKYKREKNKHIKTLYGKCKIIFEKRRQNVLDFIDRNYKKNEFHPLLFWANI